MVRVLVVEDEANIREMIALNLRLTGMEAVEAESAEAALPLLAKKPGCDAAILDVMLPGGCCWTVRIFGKSPKRFAVCGFGWAWCFNIRRDRKSTRLNSSHRT